MFGDPREFGGGLICRPIWIRKWNYGSNTSVSPPIFIPLSPSLKMIQFHSKKNSWILPDFRPYSCRRGATTNLTGWVKLCQFRLKCFKAGFINLRYFDISVNLTGGCWIATHLFVSLQHMCKCSLCTMCGADGIISKDTSNTLEQKQNCVKMATIGDWICEY